VYQVASIRLKTKTREKKSPIVPQICGISLLSFAVLGPEELMQAQLTTLAQRSKESCGAELGLRAKDFLVLLGKQDLPHS
jgi:hypothetical protein